MAFSQEQLRRLKGAVARRHVRERQVEGKTLHYLEGWRVVAEANRIFGFEAWDRETVSSECVWRTQVEDRYAAAYLTRVRIRVRAGDRTIVREGLGSGEAIALTPGQAHERASKAAETDATKRALSTFGDRFGLSLYGERSDQGPASLRRPGTQAPREAGARSVGPAEKAAGREACDQPVARDKGQESNEGLEAEASERAGARGGTRCAGRESAHVPDREEIGPARESVSGEKAAEEREVTASKELSVGASEETNRQAGAPAVASHAQNVTAGAGASIVAAPSRLPEPASMATANDLSLSEPAEASGAYLDHSGAQPAAGVALLPVRLPPQNTERGRIDKSVLAIPEPKRLRDREHLRFVASQPCLVCARLPSQAHHLRIAQPRALGRKVSDEFTVPLCALHHYDLHAKGDEAAWWKAHSIEPLGIADALWRKRGRA